MIIDPSLQVLHISTFEVISRFLVCGVVDHMDFITQISRASNKNGVLILVQDYAIHDVPVIFVLL